MSREEKVSKQPYQCSSCHLEGSWRVFTEKILSILWRPKTDRLEAFVQIKCPKCSNMVTIIFEKLPE